jgi:16S rRNA (cytidine1402-2'-O)-methyltransferase
VATPTDLEGDISGQSARESAGARAGGLWVVATPIGNLGDLSARAREALAGADLVAAEDTRHTGQLLAHLGLSRQLVSVHDHNEAERVPGLVARMLAGARVALVSDAGTPLLSDPGAGLVGAALAAGLRVTPVPGPCAAITALSAAGLPADRFAFEGFLPAKPVARRKALEALSREPRTLVFYEAPHRIVEVIDDAIVAFGATRPAAIGRELTKLHESFYRGTLAALAGVAASDANLARGEIVLLVQGHAVPEAAAGEALPAEAERWLRLLLPHLAPSRAAGVVAEGLGLKRKALYALAVELGGAAGAADPAAEGVD